MSSVSVFHGLPKPSKPYVILPVGEHYNEKLLSLKPGDFIEFFNSAGDTEEREFVRKCFLPIDSQVFTFISRSLYGQWVSVGAIISRWESQAVLAGKSRNAFSREKCLLVEVKP